MLSVKRPAEDNKDPVLIALGGNLPGHDDAPEDIVTAGISRLSEVGLRVVVRSRLYRTPSFPDPTGPEFVNACVAVVTALPAAEVLSRLHGVEAEFGRERLVRWGQRSLDLDLLALGDHVLPDRDTFDRWMGLPLADQMRLAPERLILPHPRMQDRSFVLVPLADIAPDWRHPVLGRSVAEMLEALPQADRNSVRPIPGT